MKVLIIGGNRFFGKKLAHNLLAKGHQLTLMNRGSLDDGLGASVNRIHCDRSIPKDLEKALAGSSWDLVYDQVCYNAYQAQAAIDVFRGRVGHYIFTSSQSVYQPNQNIDESFFDPHIHQFEKPETQDSDYAEAKRQCEATFFADPSFPVTAVRLPIVVGEDDYTGRFLFHIQKVMRGEEIHFPNLKAQISFICSDDAARVLDFLGYQSQPLGPINAASESPIRLKDFVEAIERVSNKKGKLTAKATDQNFSPYGIENDWFMNIQKLISLGLKPQPIEDWLCAKVKLVRQRTSY